MQDGTAVAVHLEFSKILALDHVGLHFEGIEKIGEVGNVHFLGEIVEERGHKLVYVDQVVVYLESPDHIHHLLVKARQEEEHDESK